MKSFKTALILRSTTKKELQLPETYKIYIIEEKFTVDTKMDYIYKHIQKDNGNIITAHTTSPLNEIKKIDYKSPITDMLAKEDSLVILNEDSLTIYSKKDFNVFSDNFTSFKIFPFTSLDIIEAYTAIQNNKELQIFDKNLRRLDIIKCQCAYSIRDVLLIGDMNILKIYLRNSSKSSNCRMPRTEFSLPDFITCIFSDILFSKIFCATQDNKIYVIDMSGNELGILSNHSQQILQMKMSFCGRFLYSMDYNRICIWNVKNLVLMGFVDVEEGIEQMDVILLDERAYSNKDLLI